MDLSAVQIAVRLLVYGRTQGNVASVLQAQAPKFNRVLSGKLSVETLRGDLRKAFVESHPVLDALMPGFTEALAPVLTDKNGAEQMARLLEHASNAPGVSLDDRWRIERRKAEFYTQAGRGYDESKKKVIAFPDVLAKARASIFELSRIGSKLDIPARETLALGLRLNSLGIDMICAVAEGDTGKNGTNAMAAKEGREAQDANVERVLGEFEHLLRQTRLEYKKKAQKGTTQSTAGNVRPVREGVEVGSFTPEQIVQRQIALFAGSAIAELSSLLGKTDRVVTVFDDLFEIFDRTKRGAIETVFLGLAWPHSRDDIQETFKQARAQRAA